MLELTFQPSVGDTGLLHPRALRREQLRDLHMGRPLLDHSVVTEPSS